MTNVQVDGTALRKAVLGIPTIRRVTLRLHGRHLLVISTDRAGAIIVCKVPLTSEITTSQSLSYVTDTRLLVTEAKKKGVEDSTFGFSENQLTINETSLPFSIAQAPLPDFIFNHEQDNHTRLVKGTEFFQTALVIKNTLPQANNRNVTSMRCCTIIKDKGTHLEFLTASEQGQIARSKIHYYHPKSDYLFPTSVVAGYSLCTHSELFSKLGINLTFGFCEGHVKIYDNLTCIFIPKQVYEYNIDDTILDKPPLSLFAIDRSELKDFLSAAKDEKLKRVHLQIWQYAGGVLTINQKTKRILQNTDCNFSDFEVVLDSRKISSLIRRIERRAKIVIKFLGDDAPVVMNMENHDIGYIPHKKEE